MRITRNYPHPSLKEIYDFVFDKSKEELSDFSFLKKAIRRMGLYKGFTGLGGPITSLDFYHPDDHPYMRSDGNIIQRPEEIAAFLLHIKNYEINSYCEIGIYKGGLIVFVAAFLKKMNKNFEEICAVDTGDHCDIRFLSDVCSLRHACTSEDVRGESFDLCFIDGDHSDKWVRADWENVGRFSKIAAFHDISHPESYNEIFKWRCDVQKFWKEVSKDKTSIEIASSDLMGIGIIHNDEVV